MTLQIEITDDDVAVIEGIMGRDFSDSERLDVLKTMCSCHVQACPGSGKTTLLVAKLAILARKIPSAHQGICVLSHTNAARAEIERSLRAYASSVFRYPHFIGTIQAFVDQFMAIPALIEKFGVHPWAIDDEIFPRVAASHFVTLPYAARSFLNNRTQNNGAAVLGNLRHRFSNQECCLYRDGVEAEFWAGNQTVSGQAVESLKNKLTQEGCIAYHDAFAWANWYLTRYPDLPTVISHRFPFVFIDEMQDTDAFQWELLSRALSKSQLIQCFGDTNQAIYTARSSEAQPGWRPEAPLQVGSSHRLSQSIARLSQNVCATPQALTGNPKLPCCHHTVFLFAKDSTQKVLPAFAELLAAEGLTDGPFKAVGAVGRANPNTDHLTIMSYWPSFQRRRSPSGRMQYLQGSLRRCPADLDANGGLRRSHRLPGKRVARVVEAERQSVRPDNETALHNRDAARRKPNEVSCLFAIALPVSTGRLVPRSDHRLQTRLGTLGYSSPSCLGTPPSSGVELGS